MSPLFRLARWLRVRLGGWFWMPCPLCDEMFAGFEKPLGSMDTGLSSGLLYCPRCVKIHGKHIPLVTR